MIYLALPSVEMSKLRVAERVRHGGHAVPDADIERRLTRSLRNPLGAFSHAADSTRCLMNLGATPTLIFEQRDGVRNIVAQEEYDQLLIESGLK